MVDSGSSAAPARQPLPGLAELIDDCVDELADGYSGHNITVIGAPGTGKTTLVCTVFERLAQLPGTGPDDVLVITPNRDHATVLRDRLGPGHGGIRSAPAARSIHSFAFGLVSARSGAEEGRASRFVSGAEQDAFLADMLAGYESGRVAGPAWPEHLSAEVRATRGFRDQLREALNEVMARTLDPVEVTDVAIGCERPEWAVLGHMMREYMELNTFPGFSGVDTASVLTEARSILIEQRDRGVHAGGRWDFSVPGRPAAGEQSQAVPRFVLVDAAQDLPDGALAILTELAALGCRLLITASPDTTTQAFRGATGLLIRQAARHDGTDNPLAGPAGMRTCVLDPRDPACRGQGALTGLWHRFARLLSTEQAYGHLPAETDALSPPAEPGSRPAEFAVFGSAAERTRGIARTLRRLHHDEGYDWAECAVLCRTAGTAAALRQELEHLGIPVAGSSMSLAADPATAPLLRLLRLDAADDAAVEAVARELLTGVYGAVDALAVRGLERELAVLTGSPEDALLTALRTIEPDRMPAELAQVRQLFDTAAEVRSADPHTALWQLWEASGAARRWEPPAAAQPTHPLNDRLDAVIRLMTLAERYSGRDAMPAHSFAVKVLEQDFAQDSLARQHSTDMVCVDSPAGAAHRDFAAVIVADVNDGQWPNPKIRGSIFNTADLCDALDGRLDPVTAGRDGVEAQAARFGQRRRSVIRDEARLLLAALSRARTYLLVTALDDGESSPSGFFTLLRPDPTAPATGGEATPLVDSTPGGDPSILVDPTTGGDPVTAVASPGSAVPGSAVPEAVAGDAGAVTTASGTEPISQQLSLRSIAAAARSRFETASTDTERRQWAQLLAALVGQQVSEAHISRWQRWYDRSSETPIRTGEQMVTISPSTVETFVTCPLQWFLSQHAGHSDVTQAQTTGTLIHALAEEFPDGGLLEMQAAFEERFEQLEFDSEWEREQEHEAIANMVENLSTYLRARRSVGTLVGVEARVSAIEHDPDKGGPWQIRGRLDRVEQIRSGGGLYVIDFKTGKNAPTKKEMDEHAQLGTYQAALAHPSGVVELTDGTTVTGKPAGAELVFLRKTAPTLREQAALVTDDDDGQTWASRLVADTARQMRAAQFPATPSPEACRYCRVRTSCPAVMDTDSEEPSR